MMRTSRTPEIMGDAAYVILTKPSPEFTGQFCIDDQLLYAIGVRDPAVVGLLRCRPAELRKR